MNVKEEFLKSMELDEVYIPITNDIIDSFKKSCKEVEIEIVERERFNEKITMFRIKLSRGVFNIFQLGAITQINNTPPSSGITDKLFKDKLQ